MKCHFILLSGGSGSRMQMSVPKQFLLLGAKQVILYSAEVFSTWKRRGSFICVANPEYINETETALKSVRISSEKSSNYFQIVPGGKNRHESTLAGINALKDSLGSDDLLFFHDAARPLLLENELERLFTAFQTDQNIEIASLVSPVTETLVMANSLPGTMTQSLDRNQIYSVKTPQVLKSSSLHKFLSSSDKSEFTDLLTWGEASGIPGYLVRAENDNIKLTNISDLEVMNAILEKRIK